MQNNHFKIVFFMFFLVNILLFNACKKDKDNDTSTDTELITTVKLTLTEQGTANVVTATWKDTDGAGGTAPIIDKIALKAGKIYDGKIELLDESKSPAVNITTEIEKEKDAHLFIYQVLSGAFTVIRTDLDTKNLPVGLTTKWTAQTTGTGKVQIVLKHEPTTKTNDSAAGGETDVDVTFEVNIKF